MHTKQVGQSKWLNMAVEENGESQETQLPLPKQEQFRHVKLGFLIAPIVGSFTFALGVAVFHSPHVFNWSFVLFPPLFFGYPVAILLGVPTLVILRGLVRPTLINMAFAGAVVASLPWAILVTLQAHGHGPLTFSRWVEFMIDLPSAAFGCGFTAGAAFWAITAPRRLFRCHAEVPWANDADRARKRS